MADLSQLPWMSQEEVLEIFEKASNELLARSSNPKSVSISYRTLQRARASAIAVALRADKTLGDMGQPTFGYMTRKQVTQKISTTMERLLKNAINPMFAGAFKIAAVTLEQELNK